VEETNIAIALSMQQTRAKVPRRTMGCPPILTDVLDLLVTEDPAAEKERDDAIIPLAFRNNSP